MYPGDAQCRVCQKHTPAPMPLGCACVGDEAFAHARCLSEACGRTLTCEKCERPCKGGIRLALLRLSWAQVRECAEEDRERLSLQTEIAHALCAQGRVLKGVEVFRRILAVQVKLQGETHNETLSTMNNLGLALVRVDRWAEALSVFERVVAILDSRGETDMRALCVARKNMAVCMCKDGQHAQAEGIQRQVLEDETRMLGAKHQETLKTAGDLATSLLLQDKDSEAAELAGLVVEAHTELLGPESLTTANSVLSLAEAKYKLGQLLEAEHLFCEVFNTRRRLLPERNVSVLYAARQLVRCLYAQNRHASVQQVLEVFANTRQLRAWARRKKFSLKI